MQVITSAVRWRLRTKRPDGTRQTRAHGREWRIRSWTARGGGAQARSGTNQAARAHLAHGHARELCIGPNGARRADAQTVGATKRTHRARRASRHPCGGCIAANGTFHGSGRTLRVVKALGTRVLRRNTRSGAAPVTSLTLQRGARRLGAGASGAVKPLRTEVLRRHSRSGAAPKTRTALTRARGSAKAGGTAIRARRACRAAGRGSHRIRTRRAGDGAAGDGCIQLHPRNHGRRGTGNAASGLTIRRYLTDGIPVAASTCSRVLAVNQSRTRTTKAHASKPIRPSNGAGNVTRHNRAESTGGVAELRKRIRLRCNSRSESGVRQSKVEPAVHVAILGQIGEDRKLVNRG